MGFEVFLSGDGSRTRRLPTKADIERTFEGFVRGDETVFHRLDVGRSDADSCGIFYRDEELQSWLMVERPVDADWLWDRLFRLLQEFDLFMYWPAEDVRAVVAREDVPVYPDMPAEVVVVRSPRELRDSIT